MAEKWDCHLMDYNLHNGQHLHRHHHPRNQSFSSALLDAICKSTEVEGGMTANKKNRSRLETRNVEANNNTVTRNSRIGTQWHEDSWTNNGKFIHGISAKMGVFNAENIEAEAAYRKRREFHLSNMSSAAFCSSECASNTSSISCPYLSSDAESTYSVRTAKTGGKYHHVSREERAWKWAVGDGNLYGKSSVRDGQFRSTEKPFIPADHHAKVKSKSRTGKDSKKPKQPISPGRKLANFLNSLFTPGDTKKPKLSSSSSVSDRNSYDSSERKPASVYSSSSSVQSRPCLSKTSRGSNNSSGMSQKAVILYPTNIIMDEDSRPCGEKCLHRMGKSAPDPNPPNYPDTHPSRDACNLPALIKELELRVLEEDCHAAATAAKEIIGKYQKDHSIMEAVVRALQKQDEEEEEDNDDASCSSSELFELENLAGIDIYNVYQRELPVYGTTHLETNKAIAEGLIV